LLPAGNFGHELNRVLYNSRGDETPDPDITFSVCSRPGRAAGWLWWFWE